MGTLPGFVLHKILEACMSQYHKFILTNITDKCNWPNSQTDWPLFMDWSLLWLLCLWRQSPLLIHSTSMSTAKNFIYNKNIMRGSAAYCGAPHGAHSWLSSSMNKGSFVPTLQEDFLKMFRTPLKNLLAYHKLFFSKIQGIQNFFFPICQKGEP